MWVVGAHCHLHGDASGVLEEGAAAGGGPRCRDDADLYPLDGHVENLGNDAAEAINVKGVGAGAWEGVGRARRL